MPLDPPIWWRSMGDQRVAFSNQTVSNFNKTSSSETFWEGCAGIHICSCPVVWDDWKFVLRTKIIWKLVCWMSLVWPDQKKTFDRKQRNFAAFFFYSSLILCCDIESPWIKSLQVQCSLSVMCQLLILCTTFSCVKNCSAIASAVLSG